MKKLWHILRLTLPCMLMAAPTAFAAEPGAIDAGDTAWVLISAALVFIMTPGLGFFYGGMVRDKNVLTTIMQSFFIVAMISVEWIILGYAMTFGTDISGFIGSLDKVGLSGIGMSVLENGTIPELAFVAFQCMFAVITPALITGAFAERVKFHAFAVFILLWAVFIYNPMAHWVWGGGFLAKLGALDFAGGLVIHILSGVSGLTLCILLGKRHGLGKIPMMPHNLPMTVLGAALLWFGWFGFNGASAMSANPEAVSRVLANTMLAASAAVVVSMLSSKVLLHKPDLSMTLNGCLAGLVAITAGADCVSAAASILIGAIAGVLVVAGVLFFDKVELDDPVGALSVHLLCGVFGTLAVGIFAPEYSFRTQLIGVVSVGATAFCSAFVIFFVLKKLFGIRVSAKTELRGLDICEHGAEAYPGFQFFSNM